MAIITTTDGNEFIIWFNHCDCGLTGGCEKCRPTSYHCDKEYIYPDTHEERFLSPNLKDFYKRKGYRY